MPSSRQLLVIRENSEHACAPGWFRTPGRTSFAKFSTPIYRDKAQIVAIREDDRKRFRHDTLAEVLADTSLILGVKRGYSYGIEVDALIEENMPVTVNTTQPVGIMRDMLSRNRFDYFIAAPDEFDALTGEGGQDGGIVALDFPDIPNTGNQRFLMCAMQVEDDLIERFNAAFESLPAGGE